MNKLDILFDQKKNDLLSIYFTAGYPKQEDTNEVITCLENNHVDLIEIGIPFSDPVADGPIIQFSNSSSIENGVTLKIIFDQLKEINNASRIPKILMGYFNPVLQFGVEEFCKECLESGVDGVIIPDLPVYEYELKYQMIFERYNLHFIFLVSPQTSNDRLVKIEELSKSFIYAVSSNSITGSVNNFELQCNYFERLKSSLNRPFLIGFGVKDRKTYEMACKYSNGAIIGSSFIKALSQKGELSEKIESFIQQIKN